MENESRKDETLGSMEIDAFDLMEGEMGKRAMEQLHKQICSKFVQ